MTRIALVSTLALTLAVGCSRKPAEAPAKAPVAAPAKAAPAPAAAQPHAAPVDKQPWAGGRGSVCEPGQVNDLGVGRECRTHEQCKGFKASMCHGIKGPDRPSVCTVHCEKDADCGPDAMCGLSRGWIRSCYPKRCTDFAYGPDRQRPPKAPAAKHAGAVVCDPGFAFTDAGWGRPCSKLGQCKGEGKVAAGCSQAIYPLGIPRCTRECRDDAVCGEDAYCSYTEVETFGLCVPRCPDPRHRAVTSKPDTLDRCPVTGSIVDVAKITHRLGKACAADGDCGEGGICGGTLTAAKRKPVGCTRMCKADADCGRNSVCVDLEHGLPDAERSPGPTTYCVPACWGV